MAAEDIRAIVVGFVEPDITKECVVEAKMAERIKSRIENRRSIVLR